jgi:hypothetical protein
MARIYLSLWLIDAGGRQDQGDPRYNVGPKRAGCRVSVKGCLRRPVIASELSSNGGEGGEGWGRRAGRGYGE